MPAAAAPSGPELYAKVQAIVRDADHTTLTKKGVRSLLAKSYGKTFVEANKDAVGKMVMDAVKKLKAKKPSKKAAAAADKGTPAKATAPSAAAAAADAAPNKAAGRPAKRKSAGGDDAAATPAKKRRAAAGGKAKAAKKLSMGDEPDAAEPQASQPGDEPDDPGATKPKKLTKKAAAAAAAKAKAAKAAEMEAMANTLAPRISQPSQGIVEAVWAASQSSQGSQRDSVSNAAHRRMQQLDKAATAVRRLREAGSRALIDSAGSEELRSAARLAAPFPALAEDVAELNARADVLEEQERVAADADAREAARAERIASENKKRQESEKAERIAAERAKVVEDKKRKEWEEKRAEVMVVVKAERAKVARMAREARRLQQEKDGKMQAWEEERQKFETAEAVSLARAIAAGGKK